MNSIDVCRPYFPPVPVRPIGAKGHTVLREGGGTTIPDGVLVVKEGITTLDSVLVVKEGITILDGCHRNCCYRSYRYATYCRQMSRSPRCLRIHVDRMAPVGSKIYI